jgi:hypothetical protein
MKLSVLVPSPEFKSYAGSRIRYGRIAPALEPHGIELALEDIGDFNPLTADCDALIVSKCHDARSLVIAAILSDRGRLVGVDLFDDYFSQASDSRLSRQRNWLGQLLPECDFALCSTAAMAAVAKSYAPAVPAHVMNDPAAALDTDELARALNRKVEELNDRCLIRVAWFGVGDNPYFQVGIHDLAAWGECLAELTRGRFSVELNVLTNERALTAEALSQLRQLPVQHTVETWTEERERLLLEQAQVAFLPVGRQNFSTAKSLNRAVTALSAGCQVLSVGHPLYAPFDELIYRHPRDLLMDFERGSLRFSAERIGLYRDLVEQFASPDGEAAHLAAFLGSRTHSGGRNGPLTLIHGHATNGIAHKLVHAADGISVASPYSTTPLGYDVVFREGAAGLSMFVSEKAARRLSSAARRRLRPGHAINDRPFLEVLTEPSSRRSPAPDANSELSLPVQLATYRRSMNEIRHSMMEAFDTNRVFVSEQSPLPFPVAG